MIGLLRIAGGATPTYRFGRSEVCSPALINQRTTIQKLERDFGAALQKYPFLRDQSLLLKINLDSTGAVLLAHPLQGAQFREVTEAVQRASVGVRFRLAWRNRRPVASRVTLPVSLRSPPPPTQ